MALKKTYSKDKKTCNVTFTVTAEAAQGAKTISIAGDFLGVSNVKDIPVLMTSEDFAWYSQKIPACFYRLGVANPAKGIDSKQHTATFDIDEDSMKIGMEIMTFLTINLL